jgi:hypothetical protein
MLSPVAAQLSSNAAIQAAFRAYRGRRPCLAFELLDAAGVRIPTTEAEGHRGNVALIGVPGCDVLRTLVVDRPSCIFESHTHGGHSYRGMVSIVSVLCAAASLW